MSSYSPKRQPFETYIVHGLKRRSCSLGDQDDYWWGLQSNTHSIYIAEIELTPKQISSYPRITFPVVENFIPGLIVSVKKFRSFTGTARLNALDYLGGQKRFFYSGLLHGLDELHTKYTYIGGKTKKQESKYLGQSKGLVKIALNDCGGCVTKVQRV